MPSEQEGVEKGSIDQCLSYSDLEYLLYDEEIAEAAPEDEDDEDY
jgi:hypothetical protein